MLDFPALLRLIDERSTAFGAAVMSAPSLDLQVPSCPEWTLLDLVHHLGNGQRKWAAIVKAGPLAAQPDPPAPEAPRENWPVWWAESTKLLLSTLREAGPDRGCWTWWGSDSESPQTSRAVARHRLQEVAVHTYDAQLTAGAAQALPDEVALDGVGEFLSTCCSTASAWPHKPAELDFHATEGPTWRLSLSAAGAATVGGTGAADASVRGTASELVLTLYDRIPVDSLHVEGERRLWDQLRDWDPDE